MYALRLKTWYVGFFSTIFNFSFHFCLFFTFIFSIGSIVTSSDARAYKYTVCTSYHVWPRMNTSAHITCTPKKKEKKEEEARLSKYLLSSFSKFYLTNSLLCLSLDCGDFH